MTNTYFIIIFIACIKYLLCTYCRWRGKI